MDVQSSSTWKERLPIPTHMQLPASLLSVELLSDNSDSDVDIRSRSSGIEVDLDSPINGHSRCEAAVLGVQIDADCDKTDCDSEVNYATLCAGNLTNYISDLTLLSHVAIIGEDITGREKVSEQQPRKGADPSITEAISFSSSYEKWKRLSGPMILFLVLGLIFLVWGRGHFFQLLQWLEQLPLHFSLLVFICLFTLVSFPFGFGYIILNMMAGYLYGIVRGQLIVMLSVSVGISFSFILCRLWFKDYARGVVTSNALQAVLKVLEGPYGFKVIFLTRFTPIPFGLQNVLFAVSTLLFAVTTILPYLGTYEVYGGYVDSWQLGIMLIGLLGVSDYIPKDTCC